MADAKDNDMGVDRRWFLKTAGIAAPALIASRASAQEAGSEPAPAIHSLDTEVFGTPSDLIVETGSGNVRGYVSGGVRTFKGIPYGADTSGATRFRPPVAPEPWAGVRDAFVYGATCPQMAPGVPGRMDFLLRPQYGHASEDCLNLNVWTPETGTGGRPVMVWIHGGNYSTGSSYAIGSQDGEALAGRDDIVVVSVNHRLNILGHMDLEAVGAGCEFASSVNVGLLDLVQSLEWVRDNIARFGGDPSNVTLFGQSGGGLKITHLCGMPSARGLFHKAIVQSGSLVEVFDESMTSELAENALSEMSLAATDIEALQSISIDELQAAGHASVGAWRATSGFGNIWRTVGWAPRIEAGTIPWHPYSAEAAHISRDIALMAGSTLQEFNLSLFNPAAEAMTRDGLKDALAALYADPEAVVVQAEMAYPQQSPSSLYSIISAASFNRRNVIDQCQAKAALGGAPAYLYQFAWETPVLDGLPRAYHCAELPFVFANAQKEIQATGGGAEADLIEAQVASAWTSFARTGNPSNAALPDWESVESHSAPTMIFDAPARFEAGRDEALLEAVANLRL